MNKIIRLSIIILFCHLGIKGQSINSQTCSFPKYNDILKAIDNNMNFVELGDYLVSFGGSKISNSSKPCSYEAKYKFDKKDSIILCNHVIIVEQNCGGFFSLSLKILADKELYSILLKSITNYRTCIGGWQYIINGFYDDTQEYEGLKVSFIEDQFGDGGEVTFWHLKSW